ncbi:MAG TPA: hypothetical protein PLZ86_01310 [bacterium]|nr:hypothetical protein [bacterium]
MAKDFVNLSSEYVRMAWSILKKNPEKAAEHGVDKVTIRQASNFYENPAFSPHIGAAKALASLIKASAPAGSEKFLANAFSRLMKNDFTPDGDLTWKKAAKSYAQKADWDDDMVETQHSAIDYAAFIKSALQDLRSYSGSPYSPLHQRGLGLLHRLWSAERRWDRNLSNDLDSFLTDFEALVKNSPGLSDHMQNSTKRMLTNLMDPSGIRIIGAESPGKFNPIYSETPWTVDSAWIMFGRGNRFAEFAAPVAGAVLLLDLEAVGSLAPWKTGFENVYPERVRLPFHEEILDWIIPEQDLRETAQALGKAGLIGYQGEAPVVVGGKEMNAPIISFSDYHAWYFATPELSNFNKRTNDTPANWEKMVDDVTEAYLKLAELGFLSIQPQFYVHKEKGTVRLANLPSIFKTTEFPYNFFIESVAEAVTVNFNLESERDNVLWRVRQSTLSFLSSGRLQNAPKIEDKRFGGVAKTGKKTPSAREEAAKKAYMVCTGEEADGITNSKAAEVVSNPSVSAAAGAGSSSPIKK